MTRSFWTTGRFAGALLLASLVVVATELIVVLAQGNIEGVQAAWEGVEGIGESAGVFRTVETFRVWQAILLFAGFAVLTLHLTEAGARVPALLAFNLFVAFGVLASVEGTFHSAVTAWAGEAWARNGAVPEMYEPLRQWVNGPIQFIYSTFAYASTALYGWTFLRTKIQPRWVGRVTLGWSLAWLIVIIATHTTLPAVFLVLWLFIGVALLVFRESVERDEPTGVSTRVRETGSTVGKAAPSHLAQER